MFASYDLPGQDLSLLTSGKRNPLVTAVPAAVSYLAGCCEIVSKTCGETADKCAEAYYYYG
jgi:hypothetical protein